MNEKYEELRKLVGEIINNNTMPSFEVQHDGTYRTVDVYMKDTGKGYSELTVSLEMPLDQIAGFMTCEIIENKLQEATELEKEIKE